MKATDEQIMLALATVAAGKSNARAECEKLGISAAAFYKRRKKLASQAGNVEQSLQSLNEFPITINEIQQELKEILDALRSMTPLDFKENMQLVDRRIAALDKLANTLRAGSYFRDVNLINVQPSDSQWEWMWRHFIDPALRRAGVDKELILKTAEIIEAEWEARPEAAP